MLRRQSGESKYSTLRSLKSSLGWKEAAGGFKLFGKTKGQNSAKVEARPTAQVEEDLRSTSTCRIGYQFFYYFAC
jgi:hypothetical protein